MGVNLDIKSGIEPIISPSHAIFSCIFFTLCFVGGLYFSKKTRIGGNNPRLTKDHPHVIMNRGISVFITCIISFIGVWLLIHVSGGFKESMTILSEIYTTLVLLGFSLPTHPYHILNTFFIPLGLTMSLFIGPLFVKFLDKELPFQAKFNWRNDFLNYITTLIGFRNIIFAPMTEEFVFRCCMIPLLALADFTRVQIIFLSPLVFGIGPATNPSLYEDVEKSLYWYNTNNGSKTTI
ncbi:4871_t:CDS:2 [Funneliformis geosporum]|nr:4871_t:CDS:2 [Funneliformis geosporum]